MLDQKMRRVRRPGAGSAGAESATLSMTGGRLPLWLTAAEAETLTMLSCASPLSGGLHETELFCRLGDLLRAFQRRDRGVARPSSVKASVGNALVEA